MSISYIGEGSLPLSMTAINVGLLTSEAYGIVSQDMVRSCVVKPLEDARVRVLLWRQVGVILTARL